MSRGLGQTQQACLKVIRRCEDSDDAWWPTTYNIAAEVYQIAPDADGNRWVSDAEHVATKRALESLQRKGLIIGFRAGQQRILGVDGRTELCHSWMTEKGLARWLKRERKSAASAFYPEGRQHFLLRAERIAAKAKAIGMNV